MIANQSCVTRRHRPELLDGFIILPSASLHSGDNNNVLQISISDGTCQEKDVRLIVANNSKVGSQVLRPRRNPFLSPRFAALQKAFLSSETRTAIDKAVSSAPVVLFMKGTPEMPQCGYSRASIQILGLQGVNPQKFTAFNVLEDEELRQGMFDRKA